MISSLIVVYERRKVMMIDIMGAFLKVTVSTDMELMVKKTDGKTAQ